MQDNTEARGQIIIMIVQHSEPLVLQKFASCSVLVIAGDGKTTLYDINTFLLHYSQPTISINTVQDESKDNSFKDFNDTFILIVHLPIVIRFIDVS